jgi:hypothetical protein
VLGAKIDSDIGGNGFLYDSRKKGPRDAFGQVLDMLPGNTFVWTLTPSFRVEKFDGLQAFLGRALQGRPETVDRVIRTLLPARGFKEGADATFNIGPVKASVHKGESWTRKITRDYSPVYSLDVTCKHTYLGKQGKTEKVLVEITEVKLGPLTANPPPAETPFKVKKVKLKSGRGSGVILFDRATGRLVSSVGEVTIEADITLDIAGQQTVVELWQTEKTTIKITDTNPLR